MFTYDAPPRRDHPPGAYEHGAHCCATTTSPGTSWTQATPDRAYVGRVRRRAGKAFERIVALPTAVDNLGRSSGSRFAASEDARTAGADVSQPCVFLQRLVQAGWHGTALDPDERAVEHARAVVGVSAVCGDYMTIAGLGRFDLVTFNKVLEHVEDPVAMLSRSVDNLAEHGFVYIEVPDGPSAAAEGPEREEFFIEHLHVFSPASVALLAERAGFSPLRIDRIREPSTKYTLCAFLVPGRAA